MRLLLVVREVSTIGQLEYSEFSDTNLFCRSPYNCTSTQEYLSLNISKGFNRIYIHCDDLLNQIKGANQRYDFTRQPLNNKLILSSYMFTQFHFLTRIHFLTRSCSMSSIVDGYPEPVRSSVALGFAFLPCSRPGGARGALLPVA
ncbi:Hypothetical_protein [Hexamita inflata]|uniref:Hypothetical_protein n=1 Tax=Hexamita inflata TaxID=28002 RepID=A0AA86RES8_9EUKA|nr:Hypothetical protein HINF_LOCUS60431 [Hexamita inflata]